MKKTILSVFLVGVFTAITLQLSAQSATTIEKEKEAILKQARAFSKAFVAKDTDKIMEIYTKDASIFPNGRDILKGADKVRKYWGFNNPKRTPVSHKLTPVEVEVVGNTAYDHGYYEGATRIEGKEEISKWGGKYVVVWKKVKGVWKMHLDIWNSTGAKRKK